MEIELNPQCYSLLKERSFRDGNWIDFNLNWFKL